MLAPLAGVLSVIRELGLLISILRPTGRELQYGRAFPEAMP